MFKDFHHMATSGTPASSAEFRADYMRSLQQEGRTDRAAQTPRELSARIAVLFSILRAGLPFVTAKKVLDTDSTTRKLHNLQRSNAFQEKKALIFAARTLPADEQTTYLAALTTCQPTKSPDLTSVELAPAYAK